MFNYKKSLVATLVLGMFLFASIGIASAAGQVLTHGKWAPDTYASVQNFIDNYGNKSPNYDPNKKPYTVFDWDNTMIMNDTEEALFTYQIQKLAFKLTPEEFAHQTRQNVPEMTFPKAYNNAQGQPVTLNAVCADLASDYEFIYNNYVGMKGNMSLDQIHKTAQYLDFRAKMWYLYDAVAESCGSEVSYNWVLYFFKNMSTEEVMALAKDSNDFALGQAISKEKWMSPASLPGQAGVVGVSHWNGLRISEEMVDLVHTLRANGFDTYICSASLEDVVAVFGTYPEYGYDFPRENIIGMRLEKVDNKYQNVYKRDWVQTGAHGKTIAITKQLISEKGYGPVMIAGDSSGDFNMMTELDSVQKVLLINRAKGGSFGKLCKEAAATKGDLDAKFVLQGRNENTGLWNPNEQVIKLGKNVGVLLAD